jgi:hypothetical protein
MNFGTMATNIATRVIRPDKEDEIKEAINDAIEFCTVNGDFASDLVESTVAVNSTVYSQSIVVSTTFTRFRKIKYLKPLGYTKYLDWKDPSRMFDTAGNQCRDVWYRAGDNIVINTSALIETMLYGYYQFPERMDADEDTHWMMDYMYSAIFNLACSDIWDSIGNAEEGTRYRKKGELVLLSHSRDHRDSVAHS